MLKIKERELIKMEWTLKEKLYYYKALIVREERLKENFQVLDLILSEIGVDKEYEKELNELYEKIEEYLLFIRNEIKEKFNIESILNKKIENIRIEEIIKY